MSELDKKVIEAIDVHVDNYLYTKFAKFFAFVGIGSLGTAVGALLWFGSSVSTTISDAESRVESSIKAAETRVATSISDLEEEARLAVKDIANQTMQAFMFDQFDSLRDSIHGRALEASQNLTETEKLQHALSLEIGDTSAALDSINEEIDSLRLPTNDAFRVNLSKLLELVDSGDLKDTVDVASGLKDTRDEIDKLAKQLANASAVLTNCEFPETAQSQHGVQNTWNLLDGLMDRTCPENKVIVGVNSVHHNATEDRVWRFRCCSISIE